MIRGPPKGNSWSTGWKVLVYKKNKNVDTAQSYAIQLPNTCIKANYTAPDFTTR